jgi:uncharacterized protein YjbI with pentapeptide repeats
MRNMSTVGKLLLLAGCALVAGAVGSAIAANPDQIQQLMKTRECPGCDLTDATLMGAGLPGADLTGANLSNANLYGANLQGANLTGAVFNGANLKLANLAGATGADLSGAETDDRTTCPDGNHGPTCN